MNPTLMSGEWGHAPLHGARSELRWLSGRTRHSRAHLRHSWAHLLHLLMGVGARASLCFPGSGPFSGVLPGPLSVQRSVRGHCGQRHCCA